MARRIVRAGVPEGKEVWLATEPWRPMRAAGRTSSLTPSVTRVSRAGMDCGGESATPPLGRRAERCNPNHSTPASWETKAPPSLRLADALQEAKDHTIGPARYGLRWRVGDATALAARGARQPQPQHPGPVGNESAAVAPLGGRTPRVPRATRSPRPVMDCGGESATPPLWTGRPHSPIGRAVRLRCGRR